MSAGRFKVTWWAIVGCGMLASPVAGQDFFPSITRDYSFLPRLSVLTEAGGIVGGRRDYRVHGTFEFSITQSPLAVFPPSFLADFDDVDAHGFKRSDPEVDLVDVNAAFNLEGIRGSTGILGPRNVFQFRGKTADGSDVKLMTTVLGPWLLMRGATTPPPNSADMFRYEIHAVAHTGPLADFNDDGVVDGKDLRAWLDLPSRRPGDLLEWQRQLGEQPPTAEMEAAIDAAISASASSASGVPEPTAAALAAIGALALIGRRRR